jgi:glyoxylase-like metal-dependent hydrolase (beta-lactamase superfamily II)
MGGAGGSGAGKPSPEDPGAEARLLSGYDVLLLCAPNPGPLTLSGTNTWVVGRDPAWVLDPGPDISSHLERIASALEERGGLGGIVITHDHLDHCAAAGTLRERHPHAPLAAGRGEAEIRLSDGLRVGPFEALATPGHAPDHFALIAGRACFTGDAVLGEGSVMIVPDPGALSGYLAALERLQARDLEVICPGHGPAVWDPQKKLLQYLEHRRERERRLLAAIDRGSRSVEELLDGAWLDVPAQLRPVAALALASHLDKLAEEGRLPEGVQRP